jgi:hypothetical protein
MTITKDDILNALPAERRRGVSAADLLTDYPEELAACVKEMAGGFLGVAPGLLYQFCQEHGVMRSTERKLAPALNRVIHHKWLAEWSARCLVGRDASGSTSAVIAQ